MIARLQCDYCDRDDWDSFIPGPGNTVLAIDPTAKEMREAAHLAGWRHIVRMPPEPPESFNWATHSGECPDCIEESTP